MCTRLGRLRQAFMAKQAGDTPVIYFTGDFAEAGAVDACNASSGVTAHQQVLDIITWDWTHLRAAFPNAKVMGSLGNHDRCGLTTYAAPQRTLWLVSACPISTAALML